MSIYVRIPPNRLANARPLLNLFFSQLVSLNTQHAARAGPDAASCSACWSTTSSRRWAASASSSSAAAFLAGYNLRLLTVVQAMSQLDAVYGDKEARTFATNHGLQILYAPREQRDADEYSAMLGHFTERATSRGRSRSFSRHGHSIGQPQRERAAPRAAAAAGVQGARQRAAGGDLRELQADPRREDPLPPRQGLHARGCCRPPAVPRMDMDLHLARVQQRWRYADDELAPGQKLSVEALAHDVALLPDKLRRAAGRRRPTCCSTSSCQASTARPRRRRRDRAAQPMTTAC